MSAPNELDLMVDAIDLLGRLDYPQLVTVAALMQALLPPARRSPRLGERVQTHVEWMRAENRPAYERLAALLDALGGES